MSYTPLIDSAIKIHISEFHHSVVFICTLFSRRQLQWATKAIFLAVINRWIDWPSPRQFVADWVRVAITAAAPQRTRRSLARSLEHNSAINKQVRRVFYVTFQHVHTPRIKEKLFGGGCSLVHSATHSKPSTSSDKLHRHAGLRNFYFHTLCSHFFVIPD